MKIRVKAETILLFVLVLAAGYFLWVNNGAVLKTLGVSKMEHNAREGYAGTNISDDQYAPVASGGVNVSEVTSTGMGIASSLLPRDVAAQEDFGEFAPDEILKGQNYLNPRSLIGYPETIGGSLRNANQQIRSEPPNPRKPVSIFNTSTIVPDQMRPPFEIGRGSI